MSKMRVIEKDGYPPALLGAMRRYFPDSASRWFNTLLLSTLCANSMNTVHGYI